MFLATLSLCLLSLVARALTGELDDHRDFQYNSLVDNRGLYNYAYDTGNDPHNAHSMHMEYKDQYGVVRGRYGYTDPRGKLRVVEYEAGPGGFKARGDVGPDLYPHAKTPEKASPTPLRMAGWDPNSAPIDEKVDSPVDYYAIGYQADYVGKSYKESEGIQVKGKGATSHVAIPRTDDLVVIAPVAKSSKKSEPLRKSEPLTIHNIDLHPDDIRLTSGQQKRDASSPSRKLLASYQQPAEHRVVTVESKSPAIRVVDHDHASETKGKVVVTHDHASEAVHAHNKAHHHHAPEIRKYPLRQTHDHAAEIRTHDHAAAYRKYPLRQTHDHDAEFKKYPLRQTHVHAAEFKKYPLRQTHDHDAEFRKYPVRQTHDHDAEVKKYPLRQTHDHDAEFIKSRYTHDHNADLRSVKNSRVHDHPHDHGSAPLRVYYNDDHDTKPHEHVPAGRVYENDHDHGHSDRHVYADGRPYYNYPLKPRLLRSRPGTPYRPASYYWS